MGDQTALGHIAPAPQLGRHRGTIDAAPEYRQDHDEWVVVLTGGAVLTVDGGIVTLSAGERLLLTVPGTTWLAVRGPGPGPAG